MGLQADQPNQEEEDASASDAEEVEAGAEDAGAELSPLEDLDIRTRTICSLLVADFSVNYRMAG